MVTSWLYFMHALTGVTVENNMVDTWKKGIGRAWDSRGVDSLGNRHSTHARP